jgi:hypothetical protein
LPKKIERFNERVAQLVNDITGNMWFFWASLLFIVFLRITHPPTIDTLLLNFENDLQLLLLAANAVVGAKQLSLLMRLLKRIDIKEDRIKDAIDEKIKP